jgi:hypothetical protein
VSVSIGPLGYGIEELRIRPARCSLCPRADWTINEASAPYELVINMHRITSTISNGSALRSCFPSCSIRVSLAGGTAQKTTNPLLSRSRATLLVNGSVVTPVITTSTHSL